MAEGFHKLELNFLRSLVFKFIKNQMDYTVITESNFKGIDYLFQNYFELDSSLADWQVEQKIS